MAIFIGGSARLERHHAARRVMMPCESYSLPRGSLICHAALSPNPPRFLRAYPFLTRFSRAVLETLWYSKWVMQHIFGKLSTSTFQRYKVYANRSSDGRVIVPESRGAGAIFAHFSGEDSGQMGDAAGEPRVACRSRSHHLSNTPRPVGQLTLCLSPKGLGKSFNSTNPLSKPVRH